MPLLRPLTDAVVPFTLMLVPAVAGESWTWYPVTGEPPFDEGADQLTVADCTPACAVTPVGAPGTSGVAIGAELAAGPVPVEFTAATAKVYVLPFPSPVTVAPRPFTVTTAEGVAGETVTT